MTAASATVQTTPLAEAAELLRALAHPVRLSLILELATNPRCVHELVDMLDLSQPLISQHLRVLRSARLVRAVRRGREMAYELVDEHVSHIAADAVQHAEEHGRP